MQSFFEQLSKTLESAGSSFYGVVAAIFIAIVAIALFLIGPKATGRQERAFHVILLVLPAIVVVLFSLATGFSAGTEIVASENLSLSSSMNLSPANPLTVTLEAGAMEQLENYIEEQGFGISPETKTAALSNLINSLETPKLFSGDEALDGTSLERAFDLESIEAIDSDYAWMGASRLNELLQERYHQVALKDNNELTINWDDNINSTILDSQESIIRDFNLGKEGKIDLEFGTYYIKTRRRYTSTNPRLDYKFRVFANSIQY